MPRKKTKNEQLTRARQIRSKIAREPKRMQSGEVTLESVLQDPYSNSLGRLQVYALLRRAPGLGDKGARKVLLSCKVWPLDRTRDLDQYIREEILKDLPPRARR